VSLSLGHRADGLQVGRVRRWRNGWEGHYDPDGLGGTLPVEAKRDFIHDRARSEMNVRP
jgi:hypothetical protein